MLSQDNLDVNVLSKEATEVLNAVKSAVSATESLTKEYGSEKWFEKAYAGCYVDIDSQINEPVIYLCVKHFSFSQYQRLYEWEGFPVLIRGKDDALQDSQIAKRSFQAVPRGNRRTSRKADERPRSDERNSK